MNIFIRTIRQKVIGLLNPINTKLYMKHYTNYLIALGVHMFPYNGDGYIHNSVYFDSSDFGLFTIGKNVTISKEVIMLTHDFSITNALNAIGKNRENIRYCIRKPIFVGDNSFIGARAFILPGTNIGKNVIIGAGSVVKGDIPDNTVWIGNHLEKYCSIKEYAEKHLENGDYHDIHQF